MVYEVREMNFVFISPAFPKNYYNFCDRLLRNGFNVLGIGDYSIVVVIASIILAVLVALVVIGVFPAVHRGKGVLQVGKAVRVFSVPVPLHDVHAEVFAEREDFDGDPAAQAHIQDWREICNKGSLRSQ